MPELEFHERAKGFADALLANRTSAILMRLGSGKANLRLDAGEEAILTRAVDLVASCEAGLTATKQQSPEETGFLAWMENLKAYEAAFDALIRAELVKVEKDIASTLEAAKRVLQQVLSGQSPTRLDTTARFFDALSDINTEVAVDSESAAPQELSRPDELRA